VQTGQAPAARSVARRLLLLAVFAGLVLMHTLGHAVHEGHPLPPASSSQMAFAGLPGTHSAHGRMAHVTEPVRPALATVREDGSADEMLDPLAVCLAILLGAAIALLAMRPSRLGELTRPGAEGRSFHRALPWRRGPPVTGLSLTRIAVLRM
jgi:Family of unknown function (DUF6153)